MAVVILTGVAGTGKTLYAIQKYIIPELKSGGVVYTNIDGLIPSRISAIFNIDIFDVEKNLRKLNNTDRFFDEIENNSMVIIDEAQYYYSNRDWQKESNTDCVKYLCEHRHYGHKVVFITPHVDTLDAGIRRATQITYKHKSFSIVGNAKTVRCAVYDQTNINDTALQYFTWRHDVRIYDCYKSYINKEITEKKIRVNPFMDPKLIFILIMVIISIFTAITNLSSMSKRVRSKAEVSKVNKVLTDSQVKKNIIMINDSIIEVR